MKKQCCHATYLRYPVKEQAQNLNGLFPIKLEAVLGEQGALLDNQGHLQYIGPGTCGKIEQVERQ